MITISEIPLPVVPAGTFVPPITLAGTIVQPTL